MEVYVSQFVLFILVFVRVTALIVTAPVTSHQAIPVQGKVAVGLFLALVLYPLNAAQAGAMTTEIIPIAVLIVKEMLTGALIGFSATVIFAGIRYAGDLMSMEIGFSLANMLDPETGVQSPVLAEFLYLIALLMFLLLNGHHFVFEALHISYRAVPLGDITLSPPLMESLVRLSASVFVIAVKIAAPVIVSIFLTNVVLAILSRVMPQVNIFILSFPLKIGVGLFVLMLAGPVMVFVFKKLLSGIQEDMLKLIQVL